MLVRALKVLSYFRNEIARTDTATAALDQPGDEGCAYGRARPNWQRRNEKRSVRELEQWTRAYGRGTRIGPACGRTRWFDLECCFDSAGRQDHHDLAAFESGILLDLGEFGH